MALTGGTIWEIRTGGDDTNGAGFYNRNPGTSVDYTQQDAAQLAITDLASDGAGTGLSTATGGITAAMAGNIINIQSTGGFTPGYYEITVVTDGNNFTIDRSAGLNMSGGAGKIGGGRLTITDAFFEGMTAGDTIYLEDGTYALAANINVGRDGTAANPISLLGYKTTRASGADGTDRPLIQATSNQFVWMNGYYWIFKNIRLTTINSHGFRIGAYGRAENCKSTQSGAGDLHFGFHLGQRGTLFDCDAINDNAGAGNQGTGIRVDGYNTVRSCRVQDCKNGIEASGGMDRHLYNVIDNCDVGIKLAGTENSLIECNTLNDCDDAITATTSPCNTILLNQFTNGINGLNWSNAIRMNLIDRNNYYNNSGNDVNNVSKGPNATAIDPQYTNEAGGDFSLQSASGSIGVDYSTRLGVG